MLKRMFVLGVMTCLLFVGASQSAWAGCLTDFDQCMHNAAQVDDWFHRWLAGLDCELDAFDCVGEKLNPFLD